MVMVQFIAMVIGVISTIMIAWQIHNLNRSKAEITVRNEKPPYFQRGSKYRR